MTRPRFEACSVRGPLSFPNRSWQSTEEALEGSREGGEPSNPAGFRYLQGSTRGQDFSFGQTATVASPPKPPFCLRNGKSVR